MAPSDPNPGFLWRAQRVFFYFGLIYVIALTAMLFPIVQRQVVFMHNARWPLFPRFDAPHYHGLAPFKTLNLKLRTPDDVQIGAWYVLADPAYKAAGGNHRTSPPSDSEVRKSIADHPTVLFFHGNAANRAVKYRVQMYGQVSSRLAANVLVIDYRGFGDSEGTPTELGLNLDARTAWDWLIEHGADPKNVVVMGHSLGSGVATKLVSQLGDEGAIPRALVLTAPFSSLAKVMETISFGGIPIVPIQMFPWLTQYIMRFVHTRYNTIDIIGGIRCPILLVHAANDMTIPSTHSADLLEMLLDPYLPAWPYPNASISKILSFGLKELEHIRATGEARDALTAKLLKTYEVGKVEGTDTKFGIVKEFASRAAGLGGPDVRATFLLTDGGGHSQIVRWEGVIDFVGRTAGILPA